MWSSNTSWQGGPVYSLYAHLSSISVKAGQKINLGETLGKLGYTGNGINRERAHLHLELGVMFCSNFTPWHDKYFSDANHHGNYNGMNIAGLDVASFLIAKNKNQALTIPEFVSSIPVHYKSNHSSQSDQKRSTRTAQALSVDAARAIPQKHTFLRNFIQRLRLPHYHQSE